MQRAYFGASLMQILSALLALLVFADFAAALPNDPLFSDVTGDQNLVILAFGDSITSGSHDTAQHGGYPTRLQSILGVTVINHGRGGEELAGRGLIRFKHDVRTIAADLFILNDGNSDAYKSFITLGAFHSALDQAVAYVKRRKRHLVLATQYPELLKAKVVQPRLDYVNLLVRKVAARNGIRVVDIDRAWRSTCDRVPRCNLLASDGLHPNSTGYDVITDVVLGALAHIAIFKAGGAAQVEAAYGLANGSVLVKPD
jgi:lysophospholipase L1-like esterase